MSTATPPPARADARPLPDSPRPTHRDEDRFIRSAFRYHSRTFSLATWLLPRTERLPVATLYYYCRTVDTLADETVLEIGADRARAEIDRLRYQLDATLDGSPPRDSPESFLWPRLAEINRTYGLHRRAMHQLLDGAAWDLEGRSITSMGDLMAYSDLVAGSVGAMMLPFLVRDKSDVERLDAPARALGCAMQLTNIIRDVGEDWRDLQRVYLPSDDLKAAGLDIDALYSGAQNWPRYVAFIESIMGSADSLYDDASTGITNLRPATQLGVRSASRMYREILNSVRANGYDNLTKRAFVPLRRKLLLVASGGAYVTRRARLIGPSA